MASLKERIDKITQFIEVDIWRIKLDSIPWGRSFLYRQIRVLVLAGKGFVRDEVGVKSSALTYFTLLSIVPVIALAFGISKGFGFDIQSTITRLLAGQEDLTKYAFDAAENMLDNAKGGVVAGVGLVVLLYTVLRLLNSIEETFNDIWEIKKQRSLQRKISEYTAILLISPILVFFSSSLTVLASSEVGKLTEQIELLNLFAPLILFLLKFLPYTLIWLLLILLYLIMPNTGVKIKSAMIAGIVAGTAFQLLQWGYIEFQVGVSKYNYIYGSLAALPLFLIWAQSSWMIVLFGAELSFAHQNAARYEFSNETLQPSTRHKEFIALLIVRLLILRFKKGEPGLTVGEITDRLLVPFRFANVIVRELVEVKILSEINMGEREENTYQPAMDIDLITAYLVIDRLENRGLNNICILNDDEATLMLQTIDTMEADMDKSMVNRPLGELHL
ncbi:MAG: YihY/virulence factor BrkB family protein [Imperialibacter sp.]|uniref:YihY/virulence factor BrkB family protein n=1 Tax=Imperialibacter sp. TaxID=2038411 RepID=UPI003A8C4419